MMFLGGWLGGVTWDEKTHVLMLRTYFTDGWNVSPDALLAGVPDPAYIWGVYVYGPVGELVAHLFTTLVGLESWGDPTTSASAYAGRHIAIGLMALAGVAAVGLTVRVVLRSWGWSVVGAALLAVTPLWVGHGMFNIKDIPVAAGYSIATLGLVALARRDYLVNRRLRTLGLLALFLGSVLAAGTREALGVPIAAGAVITVCFVWLASLRARPLPWRSATIDAARRLLDATLMLVATYLTMLLIYPKAFINPVVLAWQALVVSARFPFNEPVLTSGTWVEQPPPWTYLPLWFGAQLPLVITLGALGFISVWIWFAVRLAMGRISPVFTPERVVMVVPVLLQLLMLPALAIALRSSIYNGSRQFLFVVPAMAVLAALGIWCLAQWVGGLTRHVAVTRGVLWSAVTVGILVPLVAQMPLFPYNYAFYNGVTAAKPIEGYWPTDYWRFSGRELMARLPAEGPEACGYEQSQRGALPPCSIEPMFTPYLDTRGSQAIPGTLSPNEHWFVRENQGLTELPAGCRMHDEILRRLFFYDVIIGQIAICDQAITAE
jgi:hypothetical protein